MNEEKRKFDLEDRLIDFAILIIGISENLTNSKAGNHISGQIVRSGTSPALHYGEAQSAESRADFIHKLKILLKELRETLVGLKIILKVPLSINLPVINIGIDECNQLISIFVKSIETAKKNLVNDAK
jgi:four helix bundle protein